MVSSLIKNPLAVLRYILLAAMLLYFTWQNTYFISVGNLYALGEAFSLLGLVTLGLAMTMIAGEFDLSVGVVVAVSGLIMAIVGEHSVTAGLLAALAFGLMVGIANSLITLKLGVSSLVTTLGVMIFLSGLAVWIEGGEGVSFTDYDLTDLFNSVWLSVLSPRSVVTIACFTLAALFLSFTRLGRDVIATGSRRKAALMSGAHVNAAIVVVFLISGFLSALAGSLLTVNLGRASSLFGSNLLLQAATAAILGGVALSGGVGRPFGVAVGVMVLAMLNNGLGLIGADTPTVLLLNGGVLLLTVLVDGAPGSWLRSQLTATGPR